MKKILIIFLASLGLNLFSQITPSSGVATKSLQIVGNSTLTLNKKGIDTLNQSARYQNTKLLMLNDSMTGQTTGQRRIRRDLDTINQNLRILKTKIDSVNQYIRALNNYTLTERQKLDTLNQSVRKNNQYFLWNNDKQDSLISATNSYSVLTYTLASTNAGTGTTANTTMGQGTFTLTLPTGTWQILSIIATQSLVSTTANIKLMAFNGGTGNFGTPSEGGTVSFNAALASEAKDTWTSPTAFNIALGSSGLAPFTNFNNNTIYSGQGMYSGDIKFVAYYFVVFTPPANQQYMFRIRCKRIY